MKPRAISCRTRFEETLRAAEREEEVLNRLDSRMPLREREQQHSHRRGDGTHQSSPEDVPVEEGEPTRRKAGETREERARR